MNRVHEQCPKIDSGIELSQTGQKRAECTKCTALASPCAPHFSACACLPAYRARAPQRPSARARACLLACLPRPSAYGRARVPQRLSARARACLSAAPAPAPLRAPAPVPRSLLLPCRAPCAQPSQCSNGQ